ncbi:ABC transporter permease [Agaribacterium haliotis]|uniref:ABC transporter permease n=1 Tax=Agaribacterium haliotis TaxID=2013869 RepID=UPI000BB599C8|nr:ABC transporter permease [Agaribacterium haliotis]
MLHNYLVLALRNLKNHSLFSVINIGSLCLGLCLCLLTAAYVIYEIDYDSGYQHSDRIVRVHRHYGGEDMHLAAVAAPFKDALEKNFSKDIERVARLGMLPAMPMSYGDVVINVDDMLFGEDKIFDIFDFEFIEGDKFDALGSANSIVLTKSSAQKFFGQQPALGKELLLYGLYPLTVTAVINDLDKQSHLRFGSLLSLENLRNSFPQDLVNWDFNNFYTYLLLNSETDSGALELKINNLLAELGNDIANDQSLSLMPLKKIHLHSNLSYEMKANGSYILVWGFSAIALLILIIACINFVNLSTARASHRAKEIGVRKSLGASRQQLITQFLFESFLMSVLAMLLALALAELLMPSLASFVELPLSIKLLYQKQGLLAMLVLLIVVTIFAGGYPAFYLSNLKAIHALKARQKNSSGARSFRTALVLLQFSTSIALIIATHIIVKQTDFALQQELGYQKAQVVNISLSHSKGYENRHVLYRTLKERLLQSEHIVSVAAAQQLPTMAFRDIWSYVKEGQKLGTNDTVSLPTLNAGYQFHQHYQIPLLAGRYFSQELGDQFVRIPSDENPIGEGKAIVSRSAAQALGYSPEQAVDKIIKIPFPPGSTNYHIVGVVEDIHLGSLKEQQKPQVYHLVQNEERFVSVRLAAGHIQEALSYIKQSWQTMLPGEPLPLRFLDKDIELLYSAEKKQSQLLAFSSALTVIIACMGLFGLAVFTTERRQKEIAIRKTLGASSSSIVMLLSKEFVLLVLSANLIAWPMAYIFIQSWLNNFSRHIELGFGPFISAALIALGLAWLTTAAHAGAIAMDRPVKRLRYE